MALTPFAPPLRVALTEPWGLFATKCMVSAPAGTRTTIALIETPEGQEPCTREIDTIDLADRDERDGLTARYLQVHKTLDGDAIAQALKTLYAHVEAALAPPRSRRRAGDTTHGDLFNAEALVAQHGAHFWYCAPWKRWLYWTGTHWQRDHGDHIMEAARETIRALGQAALEEEDTTLIKHVAKSLNHAPLVRMIAQASTLPGMTQEPEVFDTHPWLLNCTNGTLDLRTGELRDHDPADMLTKCLTIDYDPEATCPIWDSFLWRIMGGSLPRADNGAVPPQERAVAPNARAVRLIAFLQKAVGYACTGDTGEECLFLLHGAGRNGKSKFLSTIKTLLGPYAKTADMQTFLHKDRETVRNDLADLAGTRFVCASETSEHTRLAEGLIKQLTGNDGIKARFLFEEYFEFPPQFKIFLAFNHRPRTGNTDDEAFWSRIREIPFTVFIPPEDRDKDLSEKLCGELPGILAWAVRGCRRWQEDKGLTEPAEVIDATKEYRHESDTIGRFLDEQCDCLQGDATLEASSSALFLAFHQWCEAGHEPALSKNAFGRALTARGYPLKAGTHNTQMRTGLTLRQRAALPSNEDPEKWNDRSYARGKG